MNVLKSLLFATALVAGAATAASADMIKALGAGEGAVDIVAWPGYIERGETDKNYDWVTAFEKEDGLQGQRQDGRHLRRDGDADEPGRVRSRHRLGRRLVALGRRQEAFSRDQHRASFPSWKTDRRAAAERTLAHRRRQVHYGVPLSMGTQRAHAYNTDVFKEAPKSWSVVFEEQKLA